MGILRADRITGLGGANAIKGSAHFHGGGDCGGLETEVSSDFQFGSNDFTIEVWANWSGHDSSGFATIVKSGNTNASNSMFQFDYKSSESKLRLIPYVSNSSVVKQVSFTPEFDRWYHLAAVRDGNNIKIFIDGTQTGGDLAFSDTIDTETTGLSIGKRAMSDENNGYERNFNGYLSNLRIVNGTAIYTADFTPPTNELEKTSDTVLLALQSPGNLFQEATGKKLYVAADRLNQQSVTPSRKTPNSPVGFSTTTDVGSQYGTTFDGFGNFATSTYMVPPGGNTRERNRGRALILAGASSPGTNNQNAIQYFNISSLGNAQYFGTLTVARRALQGLSSSTRGLALGGFISSPATVTDTIDFVTFASTANAIDFGNLTSTAYAAATASNDTRGLFAGGYRPNNSAVVNSIDYVTIATAGNAADFGDLVAPQRANAGGSNTTRAVFAAGAYPAVTNVIQYVTIATTGNATDFGDLTVARDYPAGGGSSPTRTCFAGGRTPSNTNTIDFITTATTGNATDFGDSQSGGIKHGLVSNRTRGVICSDASITNTLEYITFATTGDALDFGDQMSNNTSPTVYSPGACSDSHGGLS